jgi:hypothetical protein
MIRNTWYELDIKFKNGWSYNSSTYRSFQKALDHQNFLFKEFGVSTRIRSLIPSIAENGIVEYNRTTKGVDNDEL